jgi:hypothetical protein
MLEQLVADECRFDPIVNETNAVASAADVFFRLKFLPRSLWQLPLLKVLLPQVTRHVI